MNPLDKDQCIILGISTHLANMKLAVNITANLTCEKLSKESNSLTR